MKYDIDYANIGNLNYITDLKDDKIVEELEGKYILIMINSWNSSLSSELKERAEGGARRNKENSILNLANDSRA